MEEFDDSDANLFVVEEEDDEEIASLDSPLRPPASSPPAAAPGPAPVSDEPRTTRAATQPFPQWYRRMTSTFRSFLNAGHLTDLTFHCGGGGEAVPCHTLVITHASPVVRRLLAHAEAADGVNGDGFHISLPDFSGAAVRSFVESLYLSALPSDASLFAECRALHALLGLRIQPDDEEIYESVLANYAKGEESADDDTTEEFDEERAGENEVVLFSVEEETIFAPPSQASNNAATGPPCPVCMGPESHHCRRKIDNYGVVANVYLCCLKACAKKSSLLKDASSFRVHMESHARRGKAQDPERVCPLCDRPRSEHLNSELESDTKKGFLYKCCHCRAAKLPSRQFFAHVENHVSKRFKCPHCSRGYAHKHLLDVHVEKDHGSGQVLFRCDCENCGFATKHKQSLHRHKMEKHDPTAVPKKADTTTVQCPVCRKKLKAWYYWQIHKKTCQTTGMTATAIIKIPCA